MTIKRHTRKRIGKTGLAMVLLGAVLGMTGFVSAPAGAAGNDHQITICHATSSESNPYSTPNPAKWQITAPNGHGNDQGDIIPPFPAGSKGSHSWAAYPGLNWDAQGQAIYAAGCNRTAPAAGSITLDKVTAGDGQPAGSTAFGFSVVCQSGTVPNAAPSITPDSPAVVVATGVTVESSCTIGETNAAGAAATTFSVNGGAEQAGPVQVAIGSDDQVVSVVVTNTYQCPQGQTPDGQGGCGSSGCVPSNANNLCTSCPAGTPNGAGGCTVVTDACPSVDGIQASVAECPIVVQDNTVTPTPEPTKPPVEVEGIQLVTSPVAATPVAAAQLPRTGNNALPLAELGLGLVFLGAGALIYGRDQTVIV